MVGLGRIPTTRPLTGYSIAFDGIIGLVLTCEIVLLYWLELVLGEADGNESLTSHWKTD